MKTIITGAAGFIGYHLANHLANQGRDLILIDNFQHGKMDDEFNELIQRNNVQFIKIDLTENDSFSSINDDILEVYHLAAINGTENFYNIPDQVLRVNILTTLNLLEWAKDKPGVKILYSSSSEVYAGALNLGIGVIPTGENVPLCIDDISNVRWSYGASKLLAENAFFSYGKQYPIRFCIVRYHNIYGPRMGFEHVIPQFYERIYNEEIPLKVYGGDQTRAFCYISDAIKATQLVIEATGTDSRIVHVGNNQEEIRIIDLAKLILKITGNPPKVIQDPPPEGSVNRRCPDISILRGLGFSPEVSIKKGLEKTRTWYRPLFKAKVK